MSSFKDNFGKNEESEALDYDDSAFYFFASTMLLIVIIIYTILYLKSIVAGTNPLERGQKVCS